MTRDREGGGRTRRLTQVHGGALPDTDVTDMGGLRVTTIARTVVDVARSLPWYRPWRLAMRPSIG